MRLRLRCSSTYVLGDLQRCMVHVPEHLHSVRDLAGHISRLLELNVRGGGAELPQLLLDGFLIPDDEEVRAVLRDDEVVDVEPTQGVALMPLQNGALQLAARAAAPAAEACATPSGKRPLSVVAGTNGSLSGIKFDSSSSTPASKRLKQNGASSAAAMAIGWQSPDAKAPAALAAVKTKPAVAAATSSAAKAKAALATSHEESEEDDDEDGDDDSAAEAETTQPRGKASGAKDGLTGSAQDAAALAQAAALATCGTAPASSATGSEENRGIFVGGLGHDLDDDQLLKFFAAYGEVESAVVVYNNHTGKSKGFGFVEFVQCDTRAKVLAAGPMLQIAGRECQVKPRQAKGGKDGGKDSGKGKDKGKKGKGKDKGKGKGKSKDAAETPRPHPVAKPKPKPKQAEESDSDDEEEESSEEDEAPPAKRPQAAATAAAPAAAAPALASLPAAPNAEKATSVASKATASKVSSKTPAISAEEAEVQKQMIALGLPVSFTASQMPGGSDGEEESEEESEEEA